MKKEKKHTIKHEALVWQESRPKKPPYNGSRTAFEKSFYERIGQTPKEFIQTKLDVGSQLSAVQYLYEITAAGIATQYSRKAIPFETYYSPKEEKQMQRIKKYNKLVRDRIPEIIESSGRKCSYETLSPENYLQMLDAKLQEELTEYQESKSLEELADLLEVMGAVVKARGYTWEQLRQIRMKKIEERGGFEKRILLKEVIED